MSSSLSDFTNTFSIRSYDTTCPPRPHASRDKSTDGPYGDGLLTIKPVLITQSSSFGAEISCIDWSQPIPDALVELNKYAVIIFRQTGLDNERHIAFSKQLGEKLEINPFFYGIENDRVGNPLLWDVGNIQLDGSLVEEDSRRWHHSLDNALWHTDSSYHQQRSKYLMLLSHGKFIPGGCFTHFADTRKAYEDLPQEKKDETEHLVIEHDLWHSRKLASPVIYKNPTAKELALKPLAYHRLVQVAPDERKTLYIASRAKTVVGRSFEDSQKLIWELIDHCTQPKYVFSMECLSSGDAVWWDNRQSLHRANPYTSQMTERDVRRSTIIDDGPFPFGVKV
ncbi:hypothetical protein VTL71DRAFT_9531 [Oculimacula yallundae]|uniref:TauD/TfdA-like domain-containing protein n=1 Tax=Oculimacula yallundae TaxID=86028 RepID=A0ABR4BS68_9HELO